MNVLIIEDSEAIAEYIKKCILDTFPNWSIDISTDYNSAIKLANINDYNLLIIDYELDTNNPQKNGLNLGRQLKKLSKYQNIPVIFETSYQEHIFDAVNELNCIYYLVKPYTDVDIIKMISKVNLSITKDEQIQFTDNQNIIFYVNLSEITYISSNRHQLTIHTIHSAYICCNHTLNTLEGTYASKLIRCHKSYLVNPSHIINIDKRNQLISVKKAPTQKEELIPIGRKYLSNF